MRRRFVVLAMVSGALFQSENARATCCNTDADCPAGITCARGACAAVTSCTCDTDCGPGLYCVPEVVTVCSGSTAQDCHPEGRCAAAWQRPCRIAADCGAGGFTCAADGQLCSPAGCQTTFMCMPPPLPATCDTTSDCPPAWTCEPDTAVVTACVSVTRNCPAGGCPPPTGAKSCMPPMFDLVGGPSSYLGPPVVLPVSCSPAGAGTAGTSGAAGTAGTSGAAGTAGTSGAAGGAVSAATDPGSGGAGQTQPAGVASRRSTGCQLVPGAPTDAAFILGASGLLGAGLLRRMKRSRVRRPSRASVTH